MSTSYTYSTLVNDLQAYMVDTDDEFVAQLPGLITNAETRIVRDLGLEILDVDYAVPTGNVDKTAGTIKKDITGLTETFAVREVYYDGKALLPRSVSFVKMMQKYLPTGDPEFYAEWNETTLYFAPLMDSGATVKNTVLRYITSVQTLSPSISTTWVSKNLGDLLLTSALIECERYNKNAEAEQGRMAEYQSLLSRVQLDAKHVKRRDYQPVSAQPNPSPAVAAPDQRTGS